MMRIIEAREGSSTSTNFIVLDKNDNYFAKTYSSWDAKQIALVSEAFSAIRMAEQELRLLHSPKSALTTLQDILSQVQSLSIKT